MTLHARIDAGVLVLALANPPVNGLSHALRRALVAELERARAAPEIQGVLIHGAGKCFSAGADIREIGTPAGMADPGLSAHVHPAIEQCGKPVLAALHGAAIGGGFETALACHYRIAHSQTRIAFPEVGLGITPLSGTQRVPRLVGVQAALEMIVESRPFTAEALRASALFDRVIEDAAALLTESLRFIRARIAERAPHPLVRERAVADAEPRQIIARWRAKLLAEPATAAKVGALESIAASFEAPSFEAGMARAREIYGELYHSPATAAARTAFLGKTRSPP